jgi:phytanoyl-CoA hydroxylase
MPDEGLLEFRRQGFVLRRGFLPAAEVQAVRDDAWRVFAAQLRRLGVTPPAPADGPEACRALAEMFQRDRVALFNCGKHCQNLISLHRLGLHPDVLGEVERLGVIAPNICTRPVLFFNHPALAEQEVYYKTPAHQDWLSMDGSLNLVVVWIPLGDVSVALGTLQVVPGSHLQGLHEPKAEAVGGFVPIPGLAEEAFVDVEVSAGDVLFFSAFLVHRSGNNVTDRLRWSCHFRYNDLQDPSFIDRRYPSPYVYRPTHERVRPGYPDAQTLRRYFGEGRE